MATPKGEIKVEIKKLSANTSLTGGCRFIAGDPAVLKQGINPYCNDQRIIGSAYCELHHKLCYIGYKRVIATKLPKEKYTAVAKYRLG